MFCFDWQIIIFAFNSEKKNMPEVNLFLFILFQNNTVTDYVGLIWGTSVIVKLQMS